MLPMRTCAECGETFEGNGACPHCDAPAPWPPVPNPRTSVPPTRSWPGIDPIAVPAAPQPEPPPARAPRRNRPLMIAIAIVVVLAIGGAAVFAITHNDDAPATSTSPPRLPLGAGLTYRSQDGRVSLKVPGPPLITELPAPINGRAVVSDGRGVEVVFLEIHAGPVATAQARTTLRSHVSIGAGLTGASVSTVSDGVFSGYPAVGGRGTFKGEPMMFIAFATSDAEYALIVHARDRLGSIAQSYERSLHVR